MDIIREDFFHFLWQNLHFAQNGLRTTCGKPVRVIHPGYRNDGDGADYRYSRIRVDGILFCGDVELHKAASEWYRHGHQRDSRYERVILHVVVHDDLHKRNVAASDGHRVPTIELRSCLPPSLSRLWRNWHRPVSLPCSGLVPGLPARTFGNIMRQWDKKYLRHRLNRMRDLFPAETPITAGWQMMVIRGIFQGLGYHKNQEPMLRLAEIFLQKRQDPRTWLTLQSRSPERIRKKIREISRLLLMDAGLVDADLVDADLVSGRTGAMKRTDWDFSASRPANRPDIRIPQAVELAIRLSRYPISAWWKKPAAELWKTACEAEVYPAPGKQRRDILLHNVIIPSVYLLGCMLHHRRLNRQALILWRKQHIPLPPLVRNTLENGGFHPGNHYNRLAILYHFKYFCSRKKCYECNVMKYFVRT